MSKIIVIEDSNFMRARLVDTLHRHGYNNTNDYNIADDIVQNPHLYLDDVDLIIADINLPGISGIDLANILKANPRYRSIPIFFISGDYNSSTIRDAICVAVDYLVKPFDDEDFIHRVAKILNRHNEVVKNFCLSKEEFIRTISLEYQRATRGKQYLGFLKFKMNILDSGKCIHQIKNRTRDIDTTYFIEDNIIIILPITNEAGVALVNGKLKSFFADCEIEILASGTYVFSGDSEVNCDDFVQTVLSFVKKCSMIVSDI